MRGDGVSGSPSSGADSEAFARWFKLYHARVLSQCVRTLGDRAAAEDIAQETLLRAWLGRERMREEDLGAWLSVVARNLCISHIRRQKKQVPTEVLPETLDESADPARLAERAESRRAVRAAMGQVGERHRRLLFLREVDGVDYEEISAELGLTPSGTRAVLFRARRVLRDRLAAVGEGFGAFIFGIRVKVSVFARRTRNVVAEPFANAGAQAGMNLALALGVAVSGYGALAQAPAVASVTRAPHQAARVADSRIAHVRPAATSDASRSSTVETPPRGRTPGHGGPVRNGTGFGKKPGDATVGGEIDDPTGTTIVYVVLERQDSPEDFSYTFYTLDAVDAWSCMPAPDICDEFDERFGKP